MRTASCVWDSVGEDPEDPDLADNYSSVIAHRLEYATHNADHVGLNPAQRRTVQHLREQLRRLLRKRDAYLALVRDVAMSPMGFVKQPNPDERDMAHEQTQGYFEHAYSTLSALASVHGRIRLYPELDEPPIGTNEKFLLWWRKLSDIGWNLTEAIDYLLAARNFRTVTAHPATRSLYDWRTDVTADDIRLVFSGSESSTGNVPDGSTRGPDGTWEFRAPEMDSVLWAFEQLCTATFGPIFTWYSDARGNTCTWEPDGIGSSIGDELATRLKEMLLDGDFDPEARALLAPNVIEDFDKYIDAMRGIREVVARAPVPTAIRTNIPAARPSRQRFEPVEIEPDGIAEGDAA